MLGKGERTYDTNKMSKTLKWCCDTKQVFLIFLYNYNSKKHFHNRALRCISISISISIYMKHRKRDIIIRKGWRWLTRLLNRDSLLGTENPARCWKLDHCR